MEPLHFNYRDIFRSGRLAFNFQRIWIQATGLLLGYLGYLVLTYLSFISAGINLNTVWFSFGLLPCILGETLPLYSRLIGYAGMLFFLFWWLATSSAVTRSAYMHLKGNGFYPWKRAMSFAFRKKGGALLSTPLTILVMIGLIIMGGFVAGLVGKIPVAGPVVISILTVLWYSVSFFLVFLILALGASMILGPAIIATTDDDAFEGVFQSFALLHGQPWRFIFYEILLFMLALVGLAAVAFFAKIAWSVMTAILIWGMGDQMADISYNATYLLQTMIYPAAVWGKAVLGGLSAYLFFGENFIPITLPAVLQLSSWLMAVTMVFVGGVVISFPAALVNSGQAVIFIVLKKIKEGDNLLERVDNEDTEEDESHEKNATVPIETE